MVDIKEYEDQFQIIGDSEELEALGHALISKSKLGDNFLCIIKDGERKPVSIEIRGDDQLEDDEQEPQRLCPSCLGEYIYDGIKDIWVCCSCGYSQVNKGV